MPLVQATNCRGLVDIEHCVVGVNRAPALEISNCAAVTVRETTLSGAPAVRLRNGTLVLSGAQCNGAAASVVVGTPASPALDVASGQVGLSGSRIAGGLGYGQVASAPAMVLQGATVSAASGGVATLVFAGNYGSPGANPAVPAVRGFASLFERGPNVFVESRQGAPWFDGVVDVAVTRPSLSLVGHTQTALYHEGLPGGIDLLLLGQPTPPSYGTGLTGALWLDPASLMVLAGVPTALPTELLPSGVSLAVQLLSVHGVHVALSSPAVFTAP